MDTVYKINMWTLLLVIYACQLSQCNAINRMAGDVREIKYEMKKK